MAVLVTGGAGYIGSHMTYALCDRGEQVVVLDNLSTGLRELVCPEAVFVEGSVADPNVLRRIFDRFAINAVIHFAGSVVVPESVDNPTKYYRNNFTASAELVSACLEHGIGNMIFSSTAAVYGVPAVTKVQENVATDPINPYGRSKLMTEWLLSDVGRAHPFRYAALRYFNVAGADPKGRTGQSTPNATHLIKRACQVALSQLPEMEIFGTDYPTPDGTGVRDYIHVADLISAHLLALDYLRKGGESAVFNVGYGHGFSVNEVIAAAKKVTGLPIPVRQSGRRKGDPAMLVADSARIKDLLGWQPQYDDLETIIKTAFDWERASGSRARLNGARDGN